MLQRCKLIPVLKVNEKEIKQKCSDVLLVSLLLNKNLPTELTNDDGLKKNLHKVLVIALLIRNINFPIRLLLRLNFVYLLGLRLFHVVYFAVKIKVIYKHILVILRWLRIIISIIITYQTTNEHVTNIIFALEKWTRSILTWGKISV